ncbi:hypothetical protein M438DRAFT_401356 [Aureobasidium pullulans EXF-150]|uniref:Uncharacterized protein n=1 Tax=Aureobasidium pullulans EXF-150 TaxID=1043002 RepID=A0A074XUE0_AURPU|nr:uncharacterized protein M438DRAFT_401356 [Aureobasidium pullulans EXF-150]KEQ89198.1 hypothetical protein M438DRAFT_401356 [Aureobasidium pullulans EXF-150]
MAEIIGIVAVGAVESTYQRVQQLTSRRAGGRNYDFGALEQEVHNVEQSLHNASELLSTTRGISETDFSLVFETYKSAIVQVTLLKQDLANVSLPILKRIGYKKRFNKALSDLTSVSDDVEDLCRILTMAYWDDVEPLPLPQHATLNKELSSSSVYQKAIPPKHSSPDGIFDSLDALEDEDDNVDDTGAGDHNLCSTSEDIISIAHSDHLSSGCRISSGSSTRLSVDEALGLVEPVEKDELASVLDADYRSTSTSYLSGSNILEGPGSAPHMYVKVSVRDGSGLSHHLDCLLDTGASVDCLIRRAETSLTLHTATNEKIECKLLFKGIWNFVDRKEEYTHLFRLVDGLPTDMVLSRHTIFQYGFLTQNPDLLLLGLTDNTTTKQELNVLGLAKISREQQKRQDQHKMEKALGNKEERARQKEQLKERLAQVMGTNQGPSVNQQQSASRRPHQGL